MAPVLEVSGVQVEEVEFARFQRTFEKVGVMASEGMRAFQEFNAARGQSPFTTGGTSH